MNRAAVQVQELLGEELSDLALRVLTSAAPLDREITNPRVQKPGLAFAGYYPYIKPGRVQIVGESETEYLRTLPAAERRKRFQEIARLEAPVFVITKAIDALPGFLTACERRGVPVFSSPALSSVIIRRISGFLEDRLVPATAVHGVLLDIYGLGVLLIGGSGVGKSESALDLVARGHSLVADDRVTVRRYPPGDLVGYCEGRLRHHMELRGLGIINVQDLFGLAAVRERKPIDLVIELEPWVDGKAYERLGLDESVYEILETPCPYIKMPVAAGRNIAMLVEIAARNHVLKIQGHHSAREFALKLQKELAEGRRRQRKRPRAV